MKNSRKNTLKNMPPQTASQNIVISILGSRLDHVGLGKKRWLRWRPTLATLMHHEFPVHEMVLIHHEQEQALADLTIADMSELSPETEVTAYCVNYEDPWDFEQVYGQLHDIVQLHEFDAEKNQYYTHITTGTHVAQICLFLLTEANYIPGKLLQTAPDPHSPAGHFQIIDLDLSCYDQIASRFAQDSQVGVAYLKGGIETHNPAFNQMMQQLEQVSIRSQAPILLTGPTGAGKSRLARRIYKLKQQRGQVTGSLIDVNCATLRGDNAMAALFGHVRGAFTGALHERAGLLREAHKGLLFLDEIGELGMDEQAMLLQAIEEKIFMPMGSDKTVNSDFQLIAGTHRNLSKAVAEGTFREDLLARINIWVYKMPSLKERIEDLDPNIDYELQRFTRLAGYKVNFNRAARQHYLAFAHSSEAGWHANFRDLNASMTRMATLAEGGRITEQLVKEEIQRLKENWALQKEEPLTPAEQLSRWLDEQQVAAIDVFDQLQLLQVIAVCQDSKNMAEAGRRLFNISRTQRRSQNDSHRLRCYLQKFGLSFNELQQ